MGRLIDEDRLIRSVENSRKTNPHEDPKIKSNHNTEHLHFLSLIDIQPTALDMEEEKNKLCRCIRKKCNDFQAKAGAEISPYPADFIQGITQGMDLAIQAVNEIIKVGGLNG